MGNVASSIVKRRLQDSFERKCQEHNDKLIHSSEEYQERKHVVGLSSWTVLLSLNAEVRVVKSWLRM